MICIYMLTDPGLIHVSSHSVFERALSDATPPSLPQTVRDALTEILRANRRAEAGASMGVFLYFLRRKMVNVAAKIRS